MLLLDLFNDLFIFKTQFQIGNCLGVKMTYLPLGMGPIFGPKLRAEKSLLSEGHGGKSDRATTAIYCRRHRPNFEALRQV